MRLCSIGTAYADMGTSGPANTNFQVLRQSASTSISDTETMFLPTARRNMSYCSISKPELQSAYHQYA